MEGDSIEEHKRALLRAREHGLDVNRIAVVAAERSVGKAFEVRYFPILLSKSYS